MPRRIRDPGVREEVDEEFAFHVEMRVRELVAQGWSEEGARTEALRRFGDIERVKDDCRELGEGRNVSRRRRMVWDGIRQDVIYALRQLRRTPGFSIVAIGTLALAIGTNAAVFSVVNAVVLQPLNYPDSDRIVRVWTRYLPPSGFDIPKFALSHPEYFDYVDANRSMEAIGAVGGTTASLTGDGAPPEEIRVGMFSHGAFEVLGVPALHGRWILEEDDQPGTPPVVVLAHELFQTRYGADPSIVGRTIEMDGRATEVLGVMPPDFEFAGLRAFIPARVDRANDNRGGHSLGVVGRLRDGVTVEAANAELESLNAGWGAEYEHNAHHDIWIERMKDDVVGDAPRTLAFLLAAVGLVLLIACANVANLLLARGERRQVEVSVRTALGADRGRIVRQLVTESLVLAAASAVLGLGIAHIALRGIVALDPTALPRLSGVGLDGPVLAFTAGAAVLTALIFGTVPALLAGRAGMTSIASAASKAAGSRGGTFLRRALVAGEVALSVVIVLFAGLTVRSLEARIGTDPRFEPEGALTFAVSLPRARYPEPEQWPAEYRAMLERLEAIPGVRVGGAGTWTPFGGGTSRWDFALDDRPPREEGEAAWNASWSAVSPGYFEALGIPVLHGRSFEATDAAGGELVAMVSERFAERFWPGEDPIGRRFGYARADEEGNQIVPWMRIVGVVPDQYITEVGEETLEQVWVPHAQAGISGYFWPSSMRVVLRSEVDPETLFGAVRAAVGEIDADLPISELGTLEEAVSGSRSGARLVSSLLGAFGGIALLLALVGIYGVISYSVAGRTREIGVRIALGAERSRVARLIVAEAFRPLAVGLALGLGIALLGAGMLESFLYGVPARDPVTFVVLPLLFAAVGVAASLAPALRATRIAPSVALREE